MIKGLNRSGFFPRVLSAVFLVLSLSAALFAQESPESNLEAVLNEVSQHLARRNYSSALELFDKLSPQDAEKTEILIMRSSILNLAGKTAEAKKIANNIIAKEPENVDALMILADAAAREGKDRDRRNFLERVIKADSKNTRALTDLGNINLGSRNLKAAAGYFDRALAAEANNGEALVGRAMIYRYNRDSKMSEQLLNLAVKEHPQWARPLHERARLYKGAGYLRDALEDLDAAKKLEPDNYWIAMDRGLVLMDMNRKQDALEEFSNAIKIAPNNFIAYVYTAGIKDEAGDYAGAEYDYTRLTKLNPEYYFAFEGLGMLKMKDKKWAEARDAFLNAYKQAPREYSYALLAAVNWMRAGKITDPKQFLAQVLRTAPRDSIEYAMLKLFHDLSGDMDVVVRVENERNLYTKSRMVFYLACYYDIRGNKTLADKYYMMVQEIDIAASVEWRLNEWILAEKGLGLRAGK